VHQIQRSRGDSAAAAAPACNAHSHSLLNTRARRSPHKHAAALLARAPQQ
jgi:hypothetical protein